jgi:acetyl esterase/lipase
MLVPLLCNLVAQSVQTDIIYRKIEGKELALDAHVPSTPNGRIFVAIHGGGFTGGNKGGNTGALCRFLASKGILCFDINYRLQRDVGGGLQNAVEAATDDAVAAYRWVESNAKKYGGDPKRISIGGSSAGAITALFATYSRDLPAKVVIDLWGGMYGKESDVMRGEAALLIIHGRNDRVVPFSHATKLNEQARSQGIKTEFLSNESGHTINLNTRINGKSLNDHIHDFLVDHS